MVEVVFLKEFNALIHKLDSSKSFLPLKPELTQGYSVIFDDLKTSFEESSESLFIGVWEDPHQSYVICPRHHLLPMSFNKVLHEFL